MLRLYAPDAPYTGEELRVSLSSLPSPLELNPRISSSSSLPNSSAIFDPQSIPHVLFSPLDVGRIKKPNHRPRDHNESPMCRITPNTATCWKVSLRSKVSYLHVTCREGRSSSRNSSRALFRSSGGSSRQCKPLISRSDMSKNIIKHLTIILTCLLDESSTVPPGVLDCIIDQFTNHASVSRPGIDHA